MRLHCYLSISLVAVFCLGLAGCSGQSLSAVHGKVTLSDGSPVQGATVVFEDVANHVSASGVTGADGSYSLTTVKPGDGVRPGTYAVSVHNPQPEDSSQGELPPVFDKRYQNPNTSGLECTVAQGATSFDIKLDRP
jgi:hypothetical protein